MNAVVTAVQSDANAYSAAVDVKLGFPKPGANVGAGIHVPPAQSVTVRYGDVLKHPTLSLWAYPTDPAVTAAAIALPGSAAVQALDATWIPASAVGQALAVEQAEVVP